MRFLSRFSGYKSGHYSEDGNNNTLCNKGLKSLIIPAGEFQGMIDFRLVLHIPSTLFPAPL